MITKTADANEKDQAYLSGYDAWGENADVDQYLRECRNNKKYSKGNWYVLLDDAVVVSSLIVYNLRSWNNTESIGIGSVATFPRHRNKGYAKRLISDVINDRDVTNVFLYADINPDYYRKLGFVSIESSGQKHSPSILMVKTKLEKFNPDYQNLPGYF